MSADASLENGHVAQLVEKGSQEYQLLAIATSNDMELLCPIRYVYDYLPHQPKWLKSQPISLSRVFTDSKERTSFIDDEGKGRHSIRLHTQAAKLPLHTGLENFRQNKYWRVNEEATKSLLELFAQDRRCSEVMLSDKQSMSSLAGDQLRTAVIDTYCRFSIYMFAEADETRIQLLAQSVILIFMFDGKRNLSLVYRES